MIDLSGVARHLRLPVEQLRVAADLLQQGYHPAFIEHYRADETGSLPRSTLWTLKLEIDRQMRLEEARCRAKDQLPKDAELDDEAKKFLERATTEVEIEATLKAFRARRALQQSQERDSQAGQLLEMLIAYSGPVIDDMDAWVADQLSIENEPATEALQQTSRLIASLIQCDTELNEKLRRTIQRKAQVQVAFCDSQPEEAKPQPAKAKSAGKSKTDKETTDVPVNPAKSQPTTEAASTEAASTDAAATAEPKGADAAGLTPSDATEPSTTVESGEGTTEQTATEVSATEVSATEVSATEVSATVESSAKEPAEVVSNETTVAGLASVESTLPDVQQPALASGETPEDSSTPVDASLPTGDQAAETASHDHDDGSHAEHHDEHDDLHGEHDDHEETADDGKSKKKSGKSKKPAKMTPRQRRRRWLIAMLQPMKSLKRPLTKLTAYQQLMLGRGRRSQLVKTHLDYDVKALLSIARDAFVTEKHPLVKWFKKSVEHALEHSLGSKIEADAVSDLEELAQEKLLENAADQLRQHLTRRPVRGHTIMLVDTVGPKAASVAVVDPKGNVLATDELPCSAQPEVVNQNVVKLGELAHKHRVTLVALTNGPARRFLVLTLRELMKQSADSGLRWTMADRGGAEAYAAGRTALKELSSHNRRDRAAIWIARCLQNPLAELLKVDINRMRLGSYQRELPQEPLKKLVRDVIADCVCSRGIDTHHAAVSELLFVPGVDQPQAQQIVALAGEGKLESRSQLIESVSDWPEQQSKQAIGWLRVFGSEQTLDATAIHPEDYRLAQRLIDNTEFDSPPGAPEGWSRPTIAEPPVETAMTDPQAVAGEPTIESTASADSVASLDANENTDEAATEQTPVGEQNSIPPAEAETATATDELATAEEPSPESPASDSSPEETASVADANADETAATDTPAADPMSFKQESSSSATETAVAGPAPEYPEDVQPKSAANGPELDIEKLARGWQVGREKLRWIATCLREPFADSRLDGTPIPLSREMPTLHSLEPGQCVWAVVVGVADFGAFVELSPDCSGLIHISRLSANYVEDPHQCVQVGDLLMTWVVSTDEKKNRVALTALSPEERAVAEAAAQHRKEERQSHSGGKGRHGQPRGDRQSQGSPGQRPRGQGQSQGQSGGDRGRGQRGGGRPRGGPQDRSRGRGGPRPAKTVVVTSKKPKAPISAAMKEGDEPLRSFSDLLQFYEAKRTDEPDTPAPKAPTATAQQSIPKEQTVEASVPDPASGDVASEQTVAPAADPSPPSTESSPTESSSTESSATDES